MVEASLNGNALRKQVGKLFDVAIRQTVPWKKDIKPLVATCNLTFGDYQCNNAMTLWSQINGTNTEFSCPLEIAVAIRDNLPQSEMIESSSVSSVEVKVKLKNKKHDVAANGALSSKPLVNGIVNVVLSRTWMAKEIQTMLIDGIDSWAPKLSIKRAVVDFSSPNIAKEMHVGHLRSTIIGDTLARILEFSNIDVLRRNHVGDWGTQFGMLIEFLFEKFPNFEDVNEKAIRDLQVFYKNSKEKFDTDPVFKEKAKSAVVRLQGGEPKYRQAWAHICQISRNEFNKVYQLLGVQLEEKGESFYNTYIPMVIKTLSYQGIIEKNEGASVIYAGKKCLIVVKSDGGYNYASTDLAALWYRLNEEQADWIVYVTDVGQQEHFDMLFNAARAAGWLPADNGTYPKASHVGFGLVLGDDGKRFRTRSTEVVRLIDLLDEAKTRCKAELVKRDNEHTADSIGYEVETLTKRLLRDCVDSKEWPDELLDNTAKEIGFEAKTHSQAALLDCGRDKEWTEEELELTAKAIGYKTKTSSKELLVNHGMGKEWTEEELERFAEAINCEVKACSKIVLAEQVKNKKWTEEELEKTSEAIGYGAIKYADLKNHRLTNYTFNYDQMLNDKGNTAVYLLYAHARIFSIIKKSGKDIEQLKKTCSLVLDHPDERALGLHLLQFSEAIEEACTNLLPHLLCEYLYNLSEYFNKFYSKCQVIGSKEESSRLLLCEATAMVMRTCFYLLGLYLYLRYDGNTDSEETCNYY
ncbi:hypothetical protein DM860_018294 [Cuscuta australis]|uniref:arginine--tRNA ligase n=1 Tax=Cuscuta australis TaxID=267555 RepID=A0A328CXS2_9ASTE|nr:hypothetical protein DM860_018294 [Cuscuta australis]